MPRCANCNKFIIGGKKQGELRFCNEDCYQRGFLARVAEEVAPELVAEQLQEIRSQDCPICGGKGPVDLSTSHTAWSIVIMTSWKDHPRLSCSKCGKKAIWRSLAFTSVFGWWGFPFGIVVTPWQLLNNFKALKKLPHVDQPSDELQHLVKTQIASELEAHAAEQ
jgi:predicted RNA-binding Zn-ribbon protein involved in translation (DUF1610 family)